MSRPLRPLALSAAVLCLGFAGCKTSTPYTAMYSPRRSYFVPPPVPKDKVAEDLLSATDAGFSATPSGLPPGGLPPADPGPVPALPPAGLPPAPPVSDPLAPPPAL